MAAIATDPHRAPHFPLSASLILFATFLVVALGEEIGWWGYAIDPMQERWNARQASVVLGVIWATWRIIAMVQTGQSAPWIALDASTCWRRASSWTGSTTSAPA